MSAPRPFVIRLPSGSLSSPMFGLARARAFAIEHNGVIGYWLRARKEFKPLAVAKRKFADPLRWTVAQQAALRARFQSFNERHGEPTARRSFSGFVKRKNP